MKSSKQKPSPGGGCLRGYAAGFAARLELVLNEAGVSQVDAAKMFHVSAAHVNHWIRGRRMPNLQNLAAILIALKGVDAMFLICGRRHNSPK